MIPPGFFPGNELVQTSTGDVLYIVESLLPRIQRVKVIDMEHSDERLIDEAELRAKVASGEIRVVRKGAPQAAALHTLTAAEDEANQVALQFLHELQSMRVKYGVSFHKAYSYLAQASSADRQQLPVPVSLSQAYRLWERERNGAPLRMGHAAKGFRGPRYKPDVYERIEALAREYLLTTHSRWNATVLTELVNLTLHKENILPKTQKVSRHLVKRIVHTRVHPDPSHKRLLARDAKAAKAVAAKKTRIARPFERVEQDALHLPWVIRTPYGDSRNVWLVHAIDCCTSIPLGWCLVIGSPRVPDTLKCIETILFPKKRLFEALGLSYDFDIYGTPAWILFDNGPENKSDRLPRLSRLSITVNRLEAYQPQKKAFIERMNRSLKTYLETLPGCTRFDGKDGERDPVALGDPVMTLAEMERWIVRFYFEHWVNNPLDRLAESVFVDNEDLGNTPLKRYRVLTEERGCPIPLPPSVDAWRSAIYEQHYRTLSRKTGISYRDYHFKGDQLPYLINQFGETKVKILVDPDDYRWVYVVDKDGRTLVSLVNEETSEITPAYSFDEADAKWPKKGPKDAASENLRQDVLNRSTEGPSKGRNSRADGPAPTGKAAKSRLTTERARHDAAVKRSAANPLPPRRPNLGAPPLDSDEDDWAKVQPLEVFDRRTGEVRP
jgi:putative transposase